MRGAAKADGRWTGEELELKALVLSGKTVVANARLHGNLNAWAKEQGLRLIITRQSRWGNPFEEGDDGDRNQVCDAHEGYVQKKLGLLKRIKAGELSGKVLFCWCKPARCHGDILARLANGGMEGDSNAD